MTKKLQGESDEMNDIELCANTRAAIRSGDIETVKRTLTDHPELFTVVSVFGTWLHYAASNGCHEIVKWLVEQGMDVNAIGGVPAQNALAHAASEGHLVVVKYLFEQGAVFDVSEPMRNPLFSCIYGCHADVAEFLLSHGIDFCVSYSGEHMSDMDAMKFAQERGCTEIVKLLEFRRSGIA